MTNTLGRVTSSSATQNLFACAGLAVLLVGFSLASPNFIQTANMITILQATSVNGVLAIAATVVIISGGIDLSVGTLMTFCAVIGGVLLTNMGLQIYVGVPGALLAGFISGALTGFMFLLVSGYDIDCYFKETCSDYYRSY